MGIQLDIDGLKRTCSKFNLTVVGGMRANNLLIALHGIKYLAALPHTHIEFVDLWQEEYSKKCKAYLNTLIEHIAFDKFRVLDLMRCIHYMRCVSTRNIVSMYCEFAWKPFVKMQLEKSKGENFCNELCMSMFRVLERNKNIINALVVGSTFSDAGHIRKRIFDDMMDEMVTKYEKSDKSKLSNIAPVVTSLAASFVTTYQNATSVKLTSDPLDSSYILLLGSIFNTHEDFMEAAEWFEENDMFESVLTGQQ